MNREELKVEVYDIEVFRSMVLYCGHNLSTGKKYQYEISRRVNELDALAKHLIDKQFEYLCGYNCINYDMQVLQYILDSYDKWYNMTSAEILEMVYSFSQEAISLSNYELPPKYREHTLDIPQIDLFKVHHYDNKNRRVGLKTLEFAMGMKNIQEIPVDWRKPDITDQEMDTTIDYCWNDVEATYQFWKVTIGETDNDLYRGKDMIQARLDIMEEVGFDHKTLNWSNSKIGDEINKKGYMKETGCTMSQIYDKKKNRKPTPKFTYGDCIPKYIKFKSNTFNDLVKLVKDIPVSLAKDDQEYVVTYNKTTYSIMRGGIHSHDGARILKTTDKHIIKDADIGSQYPNAINKRNLYPSQLGPQWNKMYGSNIVRRIEYKDLGKKGSRKHKGLAETWKDCLNAGGYGQTNQKDNWQYDPKVMYTCTIGNQFEILMLIEMLEEIDVEVVSANTDGIVSVIPVEKEPEYYRVCKDWEVIVGNDKMGQLEYADYQILVQRDVNNYMAIKTDGEVKTKGVFEIDKLLHKNNSKRIVPKALVAWYKDGTLPEDTIAGNENLYDYVIGKKASKQYSYKGIDRSNGDTNEYDQIVRYIVTLEGERLYKVAKEGSDAKVKQSKCESKEDHQLLVNDIPEYNKLEDLKINRKYYIDAVYDIIGKIQPEIIRDRKERQQGRLLLF
jgi:hypothetical protein